MIKIKRSISTMLLLSFLSSSICGAHGQNKIQKSVLGSNKNYKNRNIVTNSVSPKSEYSNMINNILLGVSVPGIASAGLYYYYQYQTEKLELEQEKEIVTSHYVEIMSPYVELEGDEEVEWSKDCEQYLVEQMAKTRYLLNKAGKSCEDKLLFPVTLLRIFNLDGVLQKLRENNIDKVYISFCDCDYEGCEDYDVYDNNVEFEISDNLEENGKEIERFNSKTNKFIVKYYIQAADVSPFYDEIVEMCKPAIDNNKFFKELLKKSYFIDFTITNDGTLYCYTPETNGFDGYSLGDKLKFDHKF